MEFRPDRIGVGIGGMKQRVQELGGSLQLANANPGTLVEGVIPPPLLREKTPSQRLEFRTLYVQLAAIRTESCVSLGNSSRPPLLLWQQAEHGYASGRSNVNPSIRYHRCNEFVVYELVAPVSSLVGVVELPGEVRGIVSVQHPRAAVLHRPNNSVRGSISGNAWRRSRIADMTGAL